MTEPDARSEEGTEREIIEFRPLGGMAQPRRIAIERDRLESMDDAALVRLHREARPIGGDHYGRPGKKMGDVGP